MWSHTTFSTGTLPFTQYRMNGDHLRCNYFISPSLLRCNSLPYFWTILKPSTELLFISLWVFLWCSSLQLPHPNISKHISTSTLENEGIYLHFTDEKLRQREVILSAQTEMAMAWHFRALCILYVQSTVPCDYNGRCECWTQPSPVEQSWIKKPISTGHLRNLDLVSLCFLISLLLPPPPPCCQQQNWEHWRPLFSGLGPQHRSAATAQTVLFSPNRPRLVTHSIHMKPLQNWAAKLKQGSSEHAQTKIFQGFIIWPNLGSFFPWKEDKRHMTWYKAMFLPNFKALIQNMETLQALRQSDWKHLFIHGENWFLLDHILENG